MAVLVAPPPIEAGESTSAERAGGRTVRVAVLLTPPPVAVMVTDTEAATAVVVMENLPVVAPAPTVVLDGTVAEESELWSVTTTPPEGAGTLSAT